MTEPTEQEVERMIGMLRSPYWQQYSTVNVRAADMLESLSSRLAAAESEVTRMYGALEQRAIAEMRLTEALAAERKDAERYRWMRDIGDETWLALRCRGVNPDFIERHVDACIAAIAESTK